MRAVDRALAGSVEIHCIGGFALTVLIDGARPTGDIDVIQVLPEQATEDLLGVAGLESNLAAKHRLRAQAVHVAEPPSDYEERLLNVTPSDFTRLTIKVIDPYDLVLTKAQRGLARDREDARALIREC